jgi:hypothetical protein
MGGGPRVPRRGVHPVSDTNTTSTTTMNVTGAVVGMIMVALLGFTIWALVKYTIPTENTNALLILIGVLSTNVTAIVSFFFGASVGNRQKDQTIAQQATTNAVAQAALTPAAADKVVGK